MHVVFAPLYEASVPVYLRYLERLLALVDAAEGLHGATNAKGGHTAQLLGARLAPDMLPFETQVVVAANFALRAAFPLAGRPVPPDASFPATFDGLRAHLSHVAALLRELPPASFHGGETRVIGSQAGHALVSLPAPAFLFQYALPNFFFHVAVAYSILRAHGLALGKADFDGFHAYP